MFQVRPRGGAEEIAQGQAEAAEHPDAEKTAAWRAEMGGVLLPGDDVAESGDFHERMGGLVNPVLCSSE
jgi:hypothetical protein